MIGLRPTLSRRKANVYGANVSVTAVGRWFTSEQEVSDTAIADQSGNAYNADLNDGTVNEPTADLPDGYVYTVDDYAQVAGAPVGPPPWTLAARVKVNNVGPYTLARNDTATYVDANGVVQTAGANVLRDGHYLTSNDAVERRVTLLERAYTNKITTALASWTPPGATITDTAVADPAGGTGAIEVTASAGAGNHHVFAATVTAIGKLSGEVWLKAGTHQYANLLFSNATDGTVNRTVINLTTGAVVTSSGLSGYTRKITVRDDGWVRIQLFGSAQTVANSTVYVQITNASGTASHTAAGTETIYVWRPTMYEAAVPPESVLTTSEVTTADSLTVDLLDATPQEANYLYEGVVLDRQASPAGIQRSLFYLGTSNAGIRFFYDSTAYMWVQFFQASGIRKETHLFSTEPPLALGDHFTCRIYQAADGSMAIGLSVHGGVESISSTTALALPGAWAANTVRFQADNCNQGLISFKAQSGAEMTLAALQALTDPDIAFYQVGMESSPYRTIMAAQTDGADYPYFGIFLDETEKLSYKARDNAGSTIGPEDGATAMTQGTTHVLVATNDGTTIKLYVDGGLDHSFANSGTFSNVDAFSFGAIPGASIFHGAVGDVIGDAAVFTRVLTPAQVLRLSQELKWPA